MSAPQEHTAETETRIADALLEGTHVLRVLDLEVHGDGDALFVGAKVDIDPDATMREVSVILYQAKRRVLAAIPAVESVFIEPDVYLDPNAKTPSTSSIVMLSSD
ncbi:MAG: cation transporter dimerization domain-containing protein [Leucobacter sp.]